MTAVTDIDERIGKCRKILDSDPNSQIFAALAEAYRRKGELDRAFRVCQNGLRIHPSYGSAHVVMAKINLDRGLYDWAEAEVRKAIDVGGRSRAIDLLLAEIYLSRGDYAAAVKPLKKLSLIDPDNAHIKKLLDIAHRIPRQEGAAGEAPTAKVPKADTVMERQPVVAMPEDACDDIDAAEVLRQAVVIPHLQGALFINTEGLVIESEWGADMDATICGAVLAEVSKSLNQELVKVSFGQVDTVLIETGQFVFYLLQAVNGMFLFVGDDILNLGALRMKIAGLLERYQPN